jgi:hypothetical protein
MDANHKAKLDQATNELRVAIKNPLVAVQKWNPISKRVETVVMHAANHTGIARTLDTNQKIVLT